MATASATQHRFSGVGRVAVARFGHWFRLKRIALVMVKCECFYHYNAMVAYWKDYTVYEWLAGIILCAPASVFVL